MIDYLIPLLMIFSILLAFLFGFYLGWLQGLKDLCEYKLKEISNFHMNTITNNFKQIKPKINSCGKFSSTTQICNNTILLKITKQRI